MASLSFAERTQGRSLLRQVCAFAIPLILTSLLSQLFNTADSIVVGRWGGATAEESEACLAAVGSCGSLINLIISLSLGLAIGAGVIVARFYGAGDSEALSDTVHTAVTSSAFVGLLLGVVGFLGAPTFLALMGTDAAAMDHAVRYMRAYFIGVPAMVIYNYAASCLRAVGDTVRPLIILSTSGVLNVVLNLVAVLGLRLGAMGVGVATAASNILSCVLVLLYLFRRPGLCHLEARRLRIRAHLLKRILIIGLPASLQTALFSISNVIIQSAVNGLGSTALIAANTAVSNVESYVYLAQNAFAQATVTFVSQSLGAGQLRRAHRSTLVCLLCGVTVAVVLGCGAFLGGRSLLRLFLPDSPEGIEIGMIRFGIVGLAYGLCAAMDVGCSALRGLGRSLLPMTISLIGACGLRIVWVFTVFAMLPTPETLYSSYPVTWAVTAIMQFIAYAVCYRRLVRGRPLAAP